MPPRIPTRRRMEAIGNGLAAGGPVAMAALAGRMRPGAVPTPLIREAAGLRAGG